MFWRAEESNLRMRNEKKKGGMFSCRPFISLRAALTPGVYRDVSAEIFYRIHQELRHVA